MKNYYQSNKEYLQDCIKMVDIMVKEATDNSHKKLAILKTDMGIKDKPADEDSYEKFSARVRAMAGESLKRKIKLPLEEIAGKARLNEDERTIMMVLAYSEATLKTEYQDPRKLIELLSMGRPEKAVDFWQYFKQGTRLFRKKIILVIDNDLRYRFSGIRLRPALVLEILGQKDPKAKAKKKSSRLPVIGSPGVLYGKLNDYVVGQDHAKKMISTAVYQHVQKIRANERRKAMDRLEKSNMLLIGPTGVGKTFMCRNIANILKLPIAFCDATQYSETGYVGMDVEQMVDSLHKAANHEKRLTERGVIYIDEIDKIARANPGSGHYGGSRDVSGESVQQELLKLLEGEVVRYTGRHFGSPSIEINVRNILFIASGAFVGLDKIIAKRLGASNRIGFSSDGSLSNMQPGSLLKRVTSEDLIEYGFLPEFVGRFPVIVAMDDLKKEDLVEIMTRPKNAIVKQYKNLFKESGFDLEIPRDTIESIAEQAIQRKTGARGLRAIMENMLSPVLFEKMENGLQKGGKIVVESKFREAAEKEPEVKAS